MTFTKYALIAAVGLALAAPVRAQTEAEKFDRLDKATKELEAARKTMADMAQLHGRVITAESEIAILKKEIADLKAQLDVLPTTALRPDTTSRSFKDMGRVRFINEHPLAMSVVVNGLSYRLAPGAERLIAVQPGEYTYQVLQIHSTPRVKRIAANEAKTFTIYADE